MKIVEAVVNQRVFQALREMLIAQGHEIVVSEVVSADPSGTHTLRYRGNEYYRGENRLKIETIVPDAEAMPVAHSILNLSRENDSTDPTVSVSHLESVLSIGITRLGNQPLSAPRAVPEKGGRPSGGFVRHALAV